MEEVSDADYFSHSMEAHKHKAVMFFHGLAGRRWCEKIAL